MRLSEGEVAAPKNKKSFTNHDASPNFFPKIETICLQGPSCSVKQEKECSPVQQQQCETSYEQVWLCRVRTDRPVLYWFPLGVQSVFQGKVHGGKRGAVQGLTFQHPFLAVSNLIFQFCSIYTRRCWCQSATPWRWDSGKQVVFLSFQAMECSTREEEECEVLEEQQCKRVDESQCVEVLEQKCTDVTDTVCNTVQVKKSSFFQSSFWSRTAQLVTLSVTH